MESRETKQRKPLTLGSLFDGSGGFPLAGILAGVEPVWASEIEPFAIRVTTKRLPKMRHYGDVSDISGADLEPVDIITFGSPCQDLSIAGKRSGLDGLRSGLFFEAVRIVKEMREKTHGEKPRFIVWENVPGAFSSNKGEDFKAVLEEVIRIKEPEAPPLPPPEKGRWPYADCYLGDGWSVAYRVLDAQYWGVPQRRARIFLVADFAGGRAPEVLFESEGVSGYTPQGFRQGESIAGDPEESLGTAGGTDAGGRGRVILNDQGGSRMDVSEDVVSTLRAEAHHPPVPYGICSKASHAMLSGNPHTGFYEADTARTLDQNGGRPDCSQGGIAVVAFSQNQRDEVRDLKNVSGTLAAEPGTKQQTYVLQGSMIGRADKNGPQGDGVNEDVSFTLDTSDRHAVAYCMTAGEFTRVGAEQSPPIMARDYKDPNVVIKEDNGRDTDKEAEGGPLCMATGQANAEIGEDLCPTLSCNHEAPIITEPYYIVRRLTPTECARLQGFPDDWCADLGTSDPADAEIAFWTDVFETHRKAVTGAKKPKTEKQIRKWLADPYSDSAEYRLWGNGVSLPICYFVLSGIVWAAGLDGIK